MSLRTRVVRLESRWETDDLLAALRAWVRSLPLDDVWVVAAYAEPDEPFPEQRYGMTKREAEERALRLLNGAPEDIRRAFLPTDGDRGRDDRGEEGPICEP